MSPLHAHPQLLLLFDPTRRAIFERIARAPAALRRLTAELGIPIAEVTRHLDALEAARLVVQADVGTRAVYRVDCDGLAEMGRHLEVEWASTLARLIAGPVPPARS